MFAFTESYPILLLLLLLLLLLSITLQEGSSDKRVWSYQDGGEDPSHDLKSEKIQ